MKDHNLILNNLFVEKHLKEYLSKSSEYWEKEGNEFSITLLKKMIRQVPAYRDFLKKNGINRKNVLVNFSKIPAISKRNYFDRYSITDVSWNGNLNRISTYSTSSGSSGKPYYFPRSSTIDMQNAVAQALFLNNAYKKNSGPILVIVTFGMGPWIGGLISYNAYLEAARALNYPISIITPGIDTKQIIKILKNLAPKYKSLIICGYPPFVKDLLDTAAEEGISLLRLNIKTTFAAENFTESFRDYIVEKTKMSRVEYETMNIYGSAELGAIGMETPLSITIRRKASQKRELAKKLF